jgi:hypothetical protein
MIEDIKIAPYRGSLKANEKYHGTKLTIGGLLEDWTEKRLRQFADYDFARLTDPFLDPKSRPRIALFWNGERIAIPWLDPALIENAHASLIGSYTVNPAAFLSLRKSGSAANRAKCEAVSSGRVHHPGAQVTKSAQACPSVGGDTNANISC